MRCSTSARILALALAPLAAACEAGLDPTPEDGSPPGADVTTPFPIDRGDEGVSTPGKYKGLWLRLTDNGQPAVTPINGVVGVVCVGMSNAQQECADYIARITSFWSSEVSSQVRITNCGIGGHAIERWIDPAFDDKLWNICRNLGLGFAGIGPQHVRVIYHKAANQFTTGADGTPLPPYPHPDSDYYNFQDNLDAFAARVRQFFPNVQAVYTSSRAYGGFAANADRGEPLSYEEGHALNSWLADNPLVDGVWHGWGPYLWGPPCAAGYHNGGGVCYQRTDFVADGVHPAPVGRGKISWLMHHRFLRDAWYRR